MLPARGAVGLGTEGGRAADELGPASGPSTSSAVVVPGVGESTVVAPLPGKVRGPTPVGAPGVPGGLVGPVAVPAV